MAPCEFHHRVKTLHHSLQLKCVDLPFFLIHLPRLLAEMLDQISVQKCLSMISMPVVAMPPGIADLRYAGFVVGLRQFCEKAVA